MDLPVFALHSVLYPGGDLELRVFEPRYLAMMRDVLPEEPFAVVAIRHGQEVGGSYAPYDIGVRVTPQDFDLETDGTYEVHVHADERVRLLEQTTDAPYARWRVEPFPEAGSAGPPVMAAALAAATRFLGIAGVEGEVSVDPDPAAMSYVLAGLTPGLVPERQALLEIPGPAERLERLTRLFRQEAALLQALRARRER